MGASGENSFDADREFLRTKARIEGAAALWEQENRDPSRLLAEGRLSTEGDETLSRQELSSNLIDSVQNSAAQVRRDRRRKGLRSGLLAVLVVLAGMSGSFAQNANVTASREELRVEEIARIEDDGDTVPRLAFSPDSRVLVLRSTGSRTSDARLIETATGRELVRFGRIVAFSPDGRWLVMRNEDGTARLIEAATGTEAVVIGPVVPGTPSQGVAFSPDGRVLAVTNDDDRPIGTSTRLIDTTTGKDVASFANDGPYWVTAISSYGGWPTIAGSGQGMRAIETTNGKVLAFLQSAPLRAHSALSPDGRWLASAYPNMQVGAMYFVRLLETATGREVTNVICYGLPPVVTFSPDGSLLAAAPCSSLYLIDTASGAERARLGSAASVAFSPDSRWLAAGSLLIETATGTEVARVEHDGSVGAVAFSPDGRLLATASTAGTAPALQATVRLLRVNP